MMENYEDKKKEEPDQPLEEDNSISDLLKDDLKMGAQNRSVHSTNVPGLNRG